MGQRQASPFPFLPQPKAFEVSPTHETGKTLRVKNKHPQPPPALPPELPHHSPCSCSESPLTLTLFSPKLFFLIARQTARSWKQGVFTEACLGFPHDRSWERGQLIDRSFCRRKSSGVQGLWSRRARESRGDVSKESSWQEK